MVRKREPGDGEEHQQQREQREEGVVGDQRGEVAGLVIAELLDDAVGNRRPRVRLLEPIDSPQQAPQLPHDQGIPVRSTVNPMVDTDVVLYDVRDGVAVLTLNRPQRMNAWT